MRANLFVLLMLVTGVSKSIAQNTPAAPAAAPASAAGKPAEQKPAADTKKAAEPAKTGASPTKPADAAKAPAPPQKSADSKNSDKDSSKDGKKPSSEADAADTAQADKNKKTAKTDAPPCVVAEFRAIGMDTQDPTKRRAQATTWLKRHAKQCSVEQLLMIRNNRSQWMGTADSAALAVTVDSLLEAIAADNPQVAAILYGTPPAPASEDGGNPGK